MALRDIRHSKMVTRLSRFKPKIISVIWKNMKMLSLVSACDVTSSCATTKHWCFTFGQLQMFCWNCFAVIRRKASIYQNKVSKVLRWAPLNLWNMDSILSNLCCTYPAFSVAVMDMWCSSASRRDEPPWISAGGADCCSVVADTPAT